MSGQKFLSNAAGIITELASVQSSAGAADAGKIPALNASGQIDSTMLPGGIVSTKTALTAPGAGTYVPVAANSFVRITMVAGGNGGSRSAGGGATGGGGGSAGAGVSIYTRLNGNTTYVVGAAGVGATADTTVGTRGGATRFGPFSVQAGALAGPTTVGANGGLGSATVSDNSFSLAGGGSGAGGANATGTAGSAAGFSPSNTANGSAAGGAAVGGGGGGGGGGDSILGMGGAGGNGALVTGAVGSVATGYGAGGGGGGAGLTTSGNGGNATNGAIIVEDFGA